MPKFEEQVIEAPETVEAPKEELQKDFKSDNEFLDSFDVALNDKRQMREFLDNAKNPQYESRVLLIGVHSLPDQFRKSDYVKGLVKNKIKVDMAAGNKVYQLAEFVTEFGIEEDYFQGETFSRMRRQNWLDRLSGNNGDLSLSFGQDADREDALREKIVFGAFEDSGIDAGSEEVKTLALEGLVKQIYSRYSFERDQADLIAYNKKLFKVTEQELTEALIKEIEKRGVDNLRKNDQLRQEFPDVNEYFNSEQAKTTAKQLIVDKLMSPKEIDKLCVYFSIPEDEISKSEFKEQRRLSAIKQIETDLSENEVYILSKIGLVAPLLKPGDLQGVFRDPKSEAALIQAVNISVQFEDERKNNIELWKSFGIPENIFKKGIVEALSLAITDTSEDGLKDVAELVNLGNLSENELKTAQSLGLLNVINATNDANFKFNQYKSLYALEKKPDSPEIQKRLKEEYLTDVREADIYKLGKIRDEFSIKWQDADRSERTEALKQGLINNFSNNYSTISTFAQIKEFINDNCPERHKIFFLMDPDIKQAVTDYVKECILDGDDSLGSSFPNEAIKYFNLSAKEITDEVKEGVEGGKFADKFLMKSREKMFPEIDWQKENEICIENHGDDLLNKAFESKNWSLIRDIKNLGIEKANRIIDEEVSRQFEILTHDDRPLNMRTYAIEFISQVSESLDYLESNYPEELISIYTAGDREKLCNLFGKNPEIFNSISDKKRDLAFDLMIDKRGYDNWMRGKILARNTIAYLKPEQLESAMQTKNFSMISEGMINLVSNRTEIPPKVFDAVYKRLSDEKEGDDQKENFIPKVFVSSLTDLLKQGAEQPQTAELLKNEALLKELARHPESVNLIKEIIEEFPERLLMDCFSDVFSILKDASPEEFQEKKQLINEINPLRKSWFLEGSSFKKMFNKVASYTPEQKRDLFKIVDLPIIKPLKFGSQEWATALMSYIGATEDFDLLQFDEASKKSMVELFNGDYKNEALSGMQNEWNANLNDKGAKYLSPNLEQTGKAINEAGGAGTLKYVEALGSLSYRYGACLENDKTPQSTKNEIRSLLVNFENRMSREKWSQDDRAELYNLSSEMLGAAPSLFTALAPIVENLSPKEMKTFFENNLPMYQAQLITIQEVKGNDGEFSYKPRDLVAVRQPLKELSARLKEKPEDTVSLMNTEKGRLVESIKGSFKERFGLSRVPEEFNGEVLRSIQNCIRYMGNINRRDAKKEAIIALYLGMELNGDWDKFRRGEELNPENYLTGDKLELIRPMIKNKMESYSLPLEIAGIPKEKAAKFQEILQSETSNDMMANIQTVDIKLTNIRKNIEELADEDIYENKSDKEVMQLLLRDGREVGAVLAKTFGEAGGKKVEFSDDEKLIKTRLEIIFNVSKWTQEDVKSIQEQIQPLSLVANMVNKMKDEKVEENVNSLQERLLPKEDIIEIFNRLGEDFKLESGAMALSRDLSYLENLAVKGEGRLNTEERAAVKEYLDSIKEKMVNLEATLDKVKEYFIKLRKSTHIEKHEILKSRLNEIEKIVNSNDTSGLMVSRMTKDLNSIIENMRQCLGCKRKEINNDTNLAFGDYNKFYMMNQSEKEKGSVADEIIFFVPITKQNGESEMSFVMDNVYGIKSPDVLINNIVTVFKKYRAIKSEIPEAKISISVSAAAMSSVGLDSTILSSRLKNLIPGLVSSEEGQGMVAEIPVSTFSDNYVEFCSGSARQTGEREFSGLTLY